MGTCPLCDAQGTSVAASTTGPQPPVLVEFSAEPGGNAATGGCPTCAAAMACAGGPRLPAPKELSTTAASTGNLRHPALKEPSSDAARGPSGGGATAGACPAPAAPKAAASAGKPRRPVLKELFSATVCAPRGCAARGTCLCRAAPRANAAVSTGRPWRPAPEVLSALPPAEKSLFPGLAGARYCGMLCTLLLQGVPCKQLLQQWSPGWPLKDAVQGHLGFAHLAKVALLGVGAGSLCGSVCTALLQGMPALQLLQQ